MSKTRECPEDKERPKTQMEVGDVLQEPNSGTLYATCGILLIYWSFSLNQNQKCFSISLPDNATQIRMPSCTVDADFLYVIVIRDYQFVSFISIAQLGIQHFDDDCLCQCCNISGLPVFRLFL